MVDRRFYVLKKVRLSDADRHEDLGIRVAVVLLECFVSEPVKVEFERQVLEVVLSDEIEFFRPELIQVAFRQRDDLSTDPGLEHFKLIVLFVLEIFIPVDIFFPVFPPEKSEGEEFAVLPGEFRQDGGHLADVRVREDPEGLVRQPEYGHGAVFVGVLVPIDPADVCALMDIPDIVVLFGPVCPQILDFDISDRDEHGVASCVDWDVVQQVMPSGGRIPDLDIPAGILGEELFNSRCFHGIDGLRVVVLIAHSQASGAGAIISGCAFAACSRCRYSLRAS